VDLGLVSLTFDASVFWALLAAVAVLGLLVYGGVLVWVLRKDFEQKEDTDFKTNRGEGSAYKIR